jgi:hypothetical protein
LTPAAAIAKSINRLMTGIAKELTSGMNGVTATLAVVPLVIPSAFCARVVPALFSS